MRENGRQSEERLKAENGRRKRKGAGWRNILSAAGLIFLLALGGCGLTGEGENTENMKMPTSWEAIPENQESAEESGENDSGSAVEAEEPASSENGETADTEEPETAEVASSEVSGIDGTMTGTEKARELVADFMRQRNLNSGNFAVAYQNLATGEVFYYNELKQWDACSTYKFPLNLLYYDMEAEGQLAEDSIVPGTQTPLSECHHQSLEFSNNELSEAMMDNLGSYDTVKQKMRKYFTLTDAEIDNSYYHHNYFCARMMMDCAAYLYQHQEEYPDALRYLEAAQPGEYFRTYLPDVTIAQKYGLRDGYNHNAGIIFGDTPFVLSVYSYQAGGNEMIGRLAELFWQYTEE